MCRLGLVRHIRGGLAQHFDPPLRCCLDHRILSEPAQIRSVLDERIAHLEHVRDAVVIASEPKTRTLDAPRARAISMISMRRVRSSVNVVAGMTDRVRPPSKWQSTSRSRFATYDGSWLSCGSRFITWGHLLRFNPIEIGNWIQLHRRRLGRRSDEARPARLARCAPVVDRTSSIRLLASASSTANTPAYVVTKVSTLWPRRWATSPRGTPDVSHVVATACRQS